MIDAQKIKKDFPIFEANPTLTYLDSAATSLKPKAVIDKIGEYYKEYSANVFRGLYDISEIATKEYESTRKAVARFIGANAPAEIIFTKGTTEAINLVAYSLGEKIIGKDDEIALSIMEHHSNFVPWQVLAQKKKASLKIIEIDKEGKLINIEKAITKKTKILALTYASNVLGTINEVAEIIKFAKSVNPSIISVIDAAQAVPHCPLKVQDLGCDFLAFSAHKMLGPTGVGVLWGKHEILKELSPFNYGGEMIYSVSLEKTYFKDPPYRFEAGTPHIAGVIAFKEAINYLLSLGMEKIKEHEEELTFYAIQRLKEEFKDSLQIFGPFNIKERVGVISFRFKDYHPHDIAQILAQDNICVRAGHHCAMPLHAKLKTPGTTRVSFYIYNTKEDIEKLIEGLKKVERLLKL